MCGICLHCKLDRSERYMNIKLILRNIGLLTCLDGYMNVALEDTEEWSAGRMTARYGDAFLRGNNGERSSSELC